MSCTALLAPYDNWTPPPTNTSLRAGELRKIKHASFDWEGTRAVFASRFFAPAGGLVAKQHPKISLMARAQQGCQRRC
jgi:hypothetical protein